MVLLKCKICKEKHGEITFGKKLCNSCQAKKNKKEKQERRWNENLGIKPLKLSMRGKTRRK